MASNTRYGFQLFKVHLHNKTTRKQLDFASARLGDAKSGSTFQASMVELLPHIRLFTRTGELSYRERTSERESDTEPRIRILSAEQSSTGERFDFVMRYGRVGSHDLAIAADEADDAELQGKASANIYRAFLYLPRTGATAILAVESRNATAPVDYLLKHLSFRFKELDEARAPTEQVGWWRLMPKGVTDTERLEEVLKQGKGAALQLEKHGLTPDGRKRPRDIVIKQNGLPASRLKRVKAMVFGWLDVEDESVDAADAPEGNSVEQVSALMDIDIITDQFDDGGVVYDDGTGKTQVIRPTSVRDVFVYPVKFGGDPPLPNEVRVAVETRLRRLLPTLSIPIDV